MSTHEYRITLGLGRMSDHHTKTYTVTASSESVAVLQAKSLFREQVAAEIGRDARIWGKMLTVSDIARLAKRTTAASVERLDAK